MSRRKRGAHPMTPEELVRGIVTTDIADAIAQAHAEGRAEGLEEAARLCWDHPASNEYGSPYDGKEG
jgi:hypothetical protein